MLVADLHHFLDMPDDAPGPARALAAHLFDIVRAVTAGDAVIEWETALPCRRRPARRRCPGRITLRRNDSPSSINWWCAVCVDDGIISHWADTPYDLRRRRPVLAAAVREVVITADVAAALRELIYLDPECERMVYAARAHPEGAVLCASEQGLDELVDAVAAESNHEPDRRRQRRLDAACEALLAAASSGR